MMIFVLGEEVGKNREGISEARTQHSTITGIRTFWVQTKDEKPTSRVFLTFWTHVYLPTSFDSRNYNLLMTSF